MSDPLADDLALWQRQAASDPLAADLVRKSRTQAQWEASPEYARLKAKHDATMAKVDKLKSEPSPWSLRGALSNPGGLGRDFVVGAGTVFEDEANAATLGLYGRAMDAVQPEASRNAAKAQMAEARQTPGWNIMSGTGQAGAAGLGAPGKVFQGLTALQQVSRPVITGALAGGITGGTHAAVDSAGRDAPGDTLRSVGRGALVGAGLGAGAGLIGKWIGGAPERKAESELAGLKEGVQNRTRVQKFVPREDDLRAALAKEPDFRALAKTDPKSALPEAQRIVRDRSDAHLNPIFDTMARTGNDQVPVGLVVNQLKAARAGFNPIAAKGQVAVIDQMIDDFQSMAQQNGGRLPAQFIRETATEFGNQGHGNVPMFGQVALPKQVKQSVSGALRESIGDHLEGLAASPGAGKALRSAYESANREVSTWLTIRDIIEEKAARATGGATPMADLVSAGVQAVKHPFMTGAKLLAGKAPDIIDRNVLGPMVGSPMGQKMAPLGQALQQGAAPVGSNMLTGAARERRRRDAELAARLMSGGGQ